MTKTARRRWSRAFPGEIDGIAFGDSGPVFVHGYDPPAGGKWMDNVIPGKLGAFDRQSGEEIWVSPCEVGYGRGFGSGLGDENDVVVLGPSIKGHRIVRMSRDSGELLGMRDIEAFDQALVYGDWCVAVTPGRVTGIMTTAMVELWSFSRDGERYHSAGRSGDRVLVVRTDQNRNLQGVISLGIEDGEFAGTFLDPMFPVIHEFVCDDSMAIALTGDRVPGRQGSGAPERLRLVAWSTKSKEAHELWRQPVDNESDDDLPEVSISLDGGKLYVAHGALLEIRDGLSGRPLGQLTLPGLDERVDWCVSQGAGLLAEETHTSVFELPA